MDRTARDGSKQHLDALTAAIRSCGITFHTWKEQGREQLKWTSLTGDGRKKVMKVYGTVSAKIAPRLKCYKNASRLNRYNFPTDNAIDFLFSTHHTTPFHYEVLKIENR